MTGMLKKVALAAGTLGLLATAAAPAEAYHYGRGYGGYGGYRHYHGGGFHGGTALGFGLLGLGVGAAIASSNRPYYGRGYGYGYDYAPPPPPPGYYGYDGYGAGYGGGCSTRWSYDPYIGRNVRVRTCY